jgi:hypothetical protein
VKLLLYFADAFAWQYLDETDYMATFWDERSPLETVLGYSSTILPVLITGRTPRETGIWTEYYRSDRAPSRAARILGRAKLLRTPINMARLVAFRFARKAGSLTAHRLRMPLEIAHHFERNQMDYRRFPPVALPVPTLEQVATDLGLRFGFRYLADGYDLEAELSWLEKALEDVDVLFLYDPSVDGRGHHVGASAAALRPELERIARFIERATGLMDEHGGAEVMLFSDHGMTNVERTFDIFAALGDLEVGRDYLVWVDSTFARFWYPTEEVRGVVHERLASAPAAFLSSEEMRGYGIDFDDDRYGQEVLAAEEGVVFHPSYISPTFFRTRGYPDKATHGYRPEAPSAYGIFCYRGNRLEGPLPRPVRATDVFGLATSVMERAPESVR